MDTPVSAPINEPVITENSNDFKIAQYSIWLLSIVSIIHFLWLAGRNKNLLHHLSEPKTGIFLIIYIILLTALNFLPVLLAYLPYKKGKYKKQLFMSIFAFIICQVLLHTIIMAFMDVTMAAC